MADPQTVLIVGAGPTGLVAAHELARAGITCRLIDKDAHRATQSRAIAIHPRTIETLELMGLADGFLAAGQRIGAVNIYGDSGRIAHVDFGGLDTRYPFVLGVPQNETERLLEEQLSRLGVSVERNTELVGLTPQGEAMTARLRRGERIEEFEARWVLGCDGAHSAVRDKLAIDFSGGTYPEQFLLADIKVEGELDHGEAQVWLHADGPLAFFPLPGDRWRLVTNSPPGWESEPSLGQCQNLLDERGLGRFKLADSRWTAVFRIHRKIAGHFRRGRGFLLGDAGHIHSPVGGQGMNMGMQDAVNLAWKLGLVIGQGGNPALLDSYEAERRPIDEAVVRQTDRATRMVTLHAPALRFIRDHLISLATRLPPVVEKLGEAISGIAVDYRASPIVADHARGAGGPRAGERAPDAVLQDARGAATSLYRLIGEHRHLLLLVGGGADGEAPPQVPELAKRPVAVRRVTAAGKGGGGDLVDHNGEVGARYGSAAMGYLIRPDGYVGFRCGWSDLSRHLPAHLATLFAPA
jgi:2-polyprenyl-6-methoxyphenol hydroxylase-like FAD-dependent oxidoreductase